MLTSETTQTESEIERAKEKNKRGHEERKKEEASNSDLSVLSFAQQ